MDRMEVPVAASYTAVIQDRETWWIGWVEEVPGVNSQGKTREELIENLRSALQEALEMNRADALAACEGPDENRRSAVPRHGEVDDHLARKICRDLGIPEP
jgi:predicted RNase H-like HicB family nuclease